MEFEMGAAKVVVLPALWVCPFCCDRPPTTDGGCFDLDVGDGGLDSSGESPACWSSEGDDQTDHQTGQQDEANKEYNEKHELGVHTLLRPPDVHVLHPKRVPGEVYLKDLEGAIKSVLRRAGASFGFLLLIGSSLILRREECRWRWSMNGNSPTLSNLTAKPLPGKAT